MANKYKRFFILVFLLIVLVACNTEPTIPVTEPLAPLPKPLEPPKLQTVPPAPVIEYFQATPDRIGLGNSAELSWYVSGATTIFLDQEIGNVAMTGIIKVYPTISTTYTITATNEGATVSSTTTVLVVPSKVGLPVINNFAADPGNVTVGSIAVLQWNVTNAESVKIDPDVGLVDPIGTIKISPSKTTSYTLAAYNNVGIVLATTQVMVTTASTSGRPDLVITDIRKVETDNGINIEYTVENRGTNDSPPSTTRLYANGVYKALDALKMLPAGGSATKTITGWLYNPATNIVKVIVDADNNVIEKNEDNNVLQIAYLVEAVFDFIDNADNGSWEIGYPYKSIAFGKLRTDDDGVALLKPGEKMEDASVPLKALETRPHSILNGLINGDYDTDFMVKPGDHFYGLVGLLHNAVSGNVQFWVYIRLHGESDWSPIVSGVNDIYDYKIKTMSVPIPPEYFGKNADFRLQVNTNGEPLQDWAVWLDAKIIR